MRAERIDLRVTYEEKKNWFLAAQEKKMKLADWIRHNCLVAIAESPAVCNEPIAYLGETRKPCKHGLLFCKKCK